jgi:hypothetical protein
MPKYFFKLDNKGPVGDPNGIELPNIDAARERAGELVQIVASDADADLFDSCSICVTDEGGKPLVTIAFPSSVRK